MRHHYISSERGKNSGVFPHRADRGWLPIRSCRNFLNRTEHLWGIVTNGFTLRLLRDCTSVRRQAYVEFDLQAIIEEQRFSRFRGSVIGCCIERGCRKPPPTRATCLLEKYYSHSIEQGGRVREHLRDGVETCLRMLGTGFLQHPANAELRRRVSPGLQPVPIESRPMRSIANYCGSSIAFSSCWCPKIADY